jgi:hypothetical protein
MGKIYKLLIKYRYGMFRLTLLLPPAPPMQVFINVGILLAYCAGIPYEHDFTVVPLFGTHISWWRFMMVFSCIPALLQVRSIWGVGFRDQGLGTNLAF